VTALEEASFWRCPRRKLSLKRRTTGQWVGTLIKGRRVVVERRRDICLEKIIKLWPCLIAGVLDKEWATA
jgi:hypothetical protein